ncbi:uncharacterized protein VTP21DRAFT_1915 [Calcarisporiella thermophila]|uniref:uncharacterized protein n=1 Tax=Calcarisporiella thermophila TaxID=911321 RepID=UPI0037420FAA
MPYCAVPPQYSSIRSLPHLPAQPTLRDLYPANGQLAPSFAPLADKGEKVPIMLKRAQKTQKRVRFMPGEELVRVRYFLREDEPRRCQSDRCPDDLESEKVEALDDAVREEFYHGACTLNNPVAVRSVRILPGGLVEGSVEVWNLAFEKRVYVHYSSDNWHTVREIGATHHSHTGHTDRFTFVIQGRQIRFAVRYEVAGQVFWDNRSGLDYTVDARPRAQPQRFAAPAKRTFLLPSLHASDSTEAPRVKRSVSKYDLEASLSIAKQQAMPRSASLSVVTPFPLNKQFSGKEYTEFVDKYCFYQPTPAIASVF